MSGSVVRPAHCLTPPQVVHGGCDKVSVILTRSCALIDVRRHTVEELQAFSNTRTPSPPWVHAVRLLVPMSCCDEAAKYLIKALGGEECTKRVVGGTKWWQVRGVKGCVSLAFRVVVFRDTFKVMLDQHVEDDRAELEARLAGERVDHGVARPLKESKRAQKSEMVVVGPRDRRRRITRSGRWTARCRQQH